MATAGYRILNMPGGASLVSSEQIAKMKGEKQVSLMLALALSDAGWCVRPEVPIDGVGVADIVARRDDEIVLIEVKVGGIVNCVHGIGQVLLYVAAFGESVTPTPVLAVPARVLEDARFRAVCDQCPVRVIPLPEADHETPQEWPFTRLYSTQETTAQAVSSRRHSRP